MSQNPDTPPPSPAERHRRRKAKSLTQKQVVEQLGVLARAMRRPKREVSHATRPPSALTALAAVRKYSKASTPPNPSNPSKSSNPSTQADPTAHESVRRGRAQDTRVLEYGRDPQPEPSRIPSPASEDSSAPESDPEDSSDPAVPAAPAHPSDAVPAPDDDRLTPTDAFDALYACGAPSLVRQTYLLTGRRELARESVERAFQQAWQRWPEVAVDRDPTGWVRAAAHEYAMSPWHQLRRSHRQPEEPPADPDDRKLLAALLDLPPSYRRTLLLYDGLGLDLPEIAAETEASTPATANRLVHAREAITAQLPDLNSPDDLHRRLAELADAEKLQTPKAAEVRADSERRARLWTRAVVATTVLLAAATALSAWTAPTHYEPPQAPGNSVTGVPPRMGPGPLTKADTTLHDRLQANPHNGPHRLVPTPN